MVNLDIYIYTDPSRDAVQALRSNTVEVEVEVKPFFRMSLFIYRKTEYDEYSGLRK